jgi:hypothetical protein
VVVCLNMPWYWTLFGVNRSLDEREVHGKWLLLAALAFLALAFPQTKHSLARGHKLLTFPHSTHVYTRVRWPLFFLIRVQFPLNSIRQQLWIQKEREPLKKLFGAPLGRKFERNSTEKAFCSCKLCWKAFCVCRGRATKYTFACKNVNGNPSCSNFWV